MQIQHFAGVALLFFRQMCQHRLALRRVHKKSCPSSFEFELIEPIVSNFVVEIYKEDANKLARRITADVAFVDPPYNNTYVKEILEIREITKIFEKNTADLMPVKPKAQDRYKR